MSKDEYLQFKRSYTETVEQREQSILSVKKEQEFALTAGDTVGSWVTLFKEHRNIDELNRRVLMSLVDKVLIHEKHTIEVVFKFRDEYAHALDYINEYSTEIAV